MTALASLSLDLDNQWSYMKTHGDAGWEEYPSYFDALAPRVVELLGELDLTITFFIVGQDAALARNGPALRSIADAGHELANHSFRHEPWLHLYTPDEIEQEIRGCEEAVGEATGARLTGFRGPGYSLSRPTLEILLERGYRYDASTLPTWLGPLARRYYFWSAKLDEKEREERGALFGHFRDGTNPIRPYHWQLGSKTLLEIPVTTLPFVRIPFHVSYVLALSAISPFVARTYFRSALQLCRVAGVEPSILLHPLDLLGADDVQELAFFPGMQLEGAVKRERLRTYLQDLQRAFEVVPMANHAESLENRAGAPRQPIFAADAGPVGTA